MGRITKTKHTRKIQDAEDKGDTVALGFSDEEAYTKKDKLLLERHRKAMHREKENSEEELFAFDDSDEEGQQEDNMASDIEGAESDDNLPDIRAWGQRKQNFYSTDYVDQDYAGLGVQEEEEAAMEEAEARSIQKRLAEQLQDADFSLDIFSSGPNKMSTSQSLLSSATAKEQIKTDVSKLSKRQKLELLQKESPEFAGLVEELKECTKLLDEQMVPVYGLVKSGDLPAGPLAMYIQTRHELLLNYCTNLSFYMVLKARRTSVQAHPVVKRLVQYRQLLDQLNSITSPEMMDHISKMADLAKEAIKERDVSSKKLAELLKKVEHTEIEMPLETETSIVRKSKKLMKNTDDEMSEGDSEAAAGSEEEADKEGKRAITYQIAKNKGLTPYRKKELRNPRVKHRMKFRKAKIRRKGQVREPKHELQKYGGEMSGIKASVSKSIKIK